MLRKDARIKSVSVRPEQREGSETRMEPSNPSLRSGRTGLQLRFRSVFAVFALLIASRSAAAHTPLTVEAMTERLGACISCHGKEGRTINTEYLPRIAGKPAGYLFNQVMNFRDGRRNNAAMSHLLQPLSDAYLREIAE